jgi:HD-GYP domain-containing protein (c-di-GMP phosphodiesterase class II)
VADRREKPTEENAAKATASPQRPPGTSPDFFSMPLSSLRMDTVTGFNLYLRNSQNKYVLYRGADLKFTEEHRQKLDDSKVRKIYIAATDRALYLRYMETNLNSIINDARISVEKKTEIVYESASQLVEDIFTDPDVEENIKRVHRTANSTVHHLLKGPIHMGPMLAAMSHDYQIYTHSVNVCVYGIGLGQRLGFSARELKELGIGLLTHDLGKTRIPTAILRKPGELTAEEQELIKRHPELGVEILEPTRQLTPASLAVVLQHHEMCDGQGYPKGLTEPEIHLHAKIAGLADVFDALTTHRSQAQAMKSFPAIQRIQREMPRAFNPELLRELILMLNMNQAGTPESTSLQEDPSQAA